MIDTAGLCDTSWEELRRKYPMGEYIIRKMPWRDIQGQEIMFYYGIQYKGRFIRLYEPVVVQQGSESYPAVVAGGEEPTIMNRRGAIWYRSTKSPHIEVGLRQDDIGWKTLTDVEYFALAAFNQGSR